MRAARSIQVVGAPQSDKPNAADVAWQLMRLARDFRHAATLQAAIHAEDKLHQALLDALKKAGVKS
jgi:hypothetical protein